MELLKIPPKIHAQYKRVVRGSSRIELEMLRRKFTRNMFLSVIKPSHHANRTYYQYGRLHFIVNKDNVVVWMSNKMNVPTGWKRDNKLFVELNKQLGIENDITEFGLLVRDTYLDQVHEVNDIKWKIGKETVLG